jgi:hypothetical protein
MAVDVNSALPFSPVQMADRLVATRNGVGGVLSASDMLALIVGALAGQRLYLALAEAVADATLLNGKPFIFVDAASASAAIYKRDTAVSTALQPKLGDIATPSLVMTLIAASKSILYATSPIGGTANAITATGVTQPELLSGKIGSFTPVATNTAAVTINFASIGEARPFLMPDSTELPAGALRLGQPCFWNYNGTTGHFHLIAPLPASVSSGGDGGGGGSSPDFVTLNISAQAANAFTLADADLPTDVDDVVMAVTLASDPATEGGWSMRVIGHPQLDEARQIRWPGGDPVLDQISDSGAVAGQLVLLTYKDTNGYATLQYPARPSAQTGGGASLSEQQLIDINTAARASALAVRIGDENAEAVATLESNLSSLALRTSPDAYASDEITLDFAQGYYNVHGEKFGAIKAAPGLTYTRTLIKGELDNGQIRQMAATNPAIIKGEGFWSRKAATNLFLNSTAGVTQNITVAAVQHTLSFLGTGTVTLSGVSTAGPLVGTGRRNRVSLSFTPTAGVLTLTITGSVQFVSLVTGASVGPIIVTVGASVAMQADALSVSATLDDEPWFAVVVANMKEAGAAARLAVFDDGNSLNTIVLERTAANDLSASVKVNNVAQTVALPAASAINGIGKVAIGIRRDAAGKFSAACRYSNGTIAVAAPTAVGTMPPATNRLQVGQNFGADQPNSPISLIRVIHGDFTDAQITAILEAL